jgi:hypothetical protein
VTLSSEALGCSLQVWGIFFTYLSGPLLIAVQALLGEVWCFQRPTVNSDSTSTYQTGDLGVLCGRHKASVLLISKGLMAEDMRTVMLTYTQQTVSKAGKWGGEEDRKKKNTLTWICFLPQSPPVHPPPSRTTLYIQTSDRSKVKFGTQRLSKERKQIKLHRALFRFGPGPHSHNAWQRRTRQWCVVENAHQPASEQAFLTVICWPSPGQQVNSLLRRWRQIKQTKTV